MPRGAVAGEDGLTVGISKKFEVTDIIGSTLMIVSARLVLVLALVSFAMQPVVAAPLTSDDLGFAFGEKAGASQVEKPAAKTTDSALHPATLQPLSAQEMRETKGAHWGLHIHHPGSLDPHNPHDPHGRLSK